MIGSKKVDRKNRKDEISEVLRQNGSESPQLERLAELSSSIQHLEWMLLRKDAKGGSANSK